MFNLQDMIENFYIYSSSDRPRAQHSFVDSEKSLSLLLSGEKIGWQHLSFTDRSE